MAQYVDRGGGDDDCALREKGSKKTDDPKSLLEPPTPSALASTQEELDPS